MHIEYLERTISKHRISLWQDDAIMQWFIQTPQTPQKNFESGALTPPPQPLEKLNFYFGRFSINSGEIVIFQ